MASSLATCIDCKDDLASKLGELARSREGVEPHQSDPTWECLGSHVLMGDRRALLEDGIQKENQGTMEEKKVGLILRRGRKGRDPPA